MDRFGDEVGHREAYNHIKVSIYTNPSGGRNFIASEAHERDWNHYFNIVIITEMPLSTVLQKRLVFDPNSIRVDSINQK